VEFLNQLNPAQREAAQQIEGPMMVIAGAGSGKTRVLTYRIAHLIQSGVEPFSILALTFTNKAAREMKDRIAQLIGEKEARNVWMGTFHSVFARILRAESERFNYDRNFTIYDTGDSRSLLKDIILGLGMDDKVYKPASIQARISAAKNNLLSARDYLENPEILSEDQQAGRPRTGEIFQTYENRCARAQAMDFDDLLYRMNVLLRDFPDLLHKYQTRFRFLLVDEYQDTNFAQYLIIKQLAARFENLCVVGDDAQSIYGFRGANIQNILNFKKDYPDFKLYKLEQNYRSTRNIVQAANSVIALNRDQIEKTVWTDNEPGNKIAIHRLYTDNEEGRFVATRIFDLRNGTQSHFRDFAILYRTNAQSRSFEESLRKLNIPYKIFGGLSFYQRKEIKDLIAYFRLTANHRDDEAFKRIINYPARGIGKTSLERLIIEASERNASLWDTLTDPFYPPGQLGGAALRKMLEFTTMIRSFHAELRTRSAHDLALHIARHTGLMHALHEDKTPEGVARYDNIQELLNGIQAFTEQQQEVQPDALPTLSDFLVDVALLTDADTTEEDENSVSLMSIHAAKGLEFPHVFVVGMEEQLFPSQMAMQSRAELEEERRLFYVALTRAEKTCTLSYALTRYRWGQLLQSEPSRFLDELDPSCIEMPATRERKPTPFSGGASFEAARRGWQAMPEAEAPAPDSGGNTGPKEAFDRLARKATPPPSPARPRGAARLTRIVPSGANEASRSEAPAPQGETGLKEGSVVQHDRFGKGKVIKLEGSPPDQKALIFFAEAGMKQLLLKFARVKILPE
jgi:DNA helicase-2/ATP-dependent DNA helicase PcrA